MQLARTLALLFTLTSLTTACGLGKDTPNVGGALQEVLTRQQLVSNAAIWAEVRAFYERREGRPAWADDDNTARTEEALQVLRSARDHGLDAADYQDRQLTHLLDALSSEEALDKPVQERALQLAELDVRLTAALLALGHDVALGRVNPQAVSSLWKARRPSPDFVSSLATAADGDLKTWLDSVRPVHPEYGALQKVLADLYAQQSKSSAPAGSSDERIPQVALNLERWRWLPDDLGARHVVVNIPMFHLVARESGKTVVDMRVVVGKQENKTPIFNAEMTTVVFSPYWNVPDSIVEGETAPAAARDPNFLSRNNIEILRLTKSGAKQVNPSTVNWDDPSELKELAFRQRPGAKNALGHVKFLFPNPFDVYLHDTPADQLFAREGRTFSHGCVRVEQPEALAKWVLRGSPEWDDARILEAMHAGEEKHVKLKQAIPVHIVYFTAWVDETGAVRFEPDPYGYDAKQLTARSTR